MRIRRREHPLLPRGYPWGLADYAPRPAVFAIDAAAGQLDAVLAPLASDSVTIIVGFTELGGAGRLYNAAAIFHRGQVVGVYRKLYPAIRKSIYEPGDRTPVYHIGGLTFGIIICNDSNYVEPARITAAQGARALFIPTNNGLPPEKAEVAIDTRKADKARAVENSVYVVRADVAGRRADGMVSYGSSEIVDVDGTVLQPARQLDEDLIVADLDMSARGQSDWPTKR